ncbi:MAG: hypothetical protein KGL43_10440 [Burkholderiales bacterium]|nr:hypothetical protein [Burkholderiales bacterium]MDE2394221.1 hypothetical protein [Burkholderiales bacterium]MDE2454002.1 hypothetical protein [Burkholderiales bacterium]
MAILALKGEIFEGPSPGTGCADSTSYRGVRWQRPPGRTDELTVIEGDHGSVRVKPCGGRPKWGEGFTRRTFRSGRPSRSARG